MVKINDIQIETLEEKFNEIEKIDNTSPLIEKGIATYIKEPDMPTGVMIKIYPDGIRKKIYIDEYFREKVLEIL